MAPSSGEQGREGIMNEVGEFQDDNRGGGDVPLTMVIIG